MRSREIHLVARPNGMPRETDFALVETTLPEPADGQVEVRNIYLSIDPSTRPRLTRGQDLNAALGGFALGRRRDGNRSQGQDQTAVSGDLRAQLQAVGGKGHGRVSLGRGWMVLDGPAPRRPQHRQNWRDRLARV